MSQFDLNSLWLSKKAGQLPDSAEIIRSAEKIEHTNRRFSRVQMALLIGAIAAIGAIGTVFYSGSISTLLGILVMLVTMVYYLFVTYRLSLAVGDELKHHDTKTYLHLLVEKINRTIRFTQTGILVYISGICLGAALLLIEPLQYLNGWLYVVPVGALLGWMALVRFVIYPVLKRKLLHRLDAERTHLNKLAAVLDE
jgi:uncharacterized membrane protein YbhN (UPF0104 family)